MSVYETAHVLLHLDEDDRASIILIMNNFQVLPAQTYETALVLIGIMIPGGGLSKSFTFILVFMSFRTLLLPHDAR